MLVRQIIKTWTYLVTSYIHTKLQKYCKTKSLQIYVNQKPFSSWSEEVKSAKTSIADNNELLKHEID